MLELTLALDVLLANFVMDLNKHVGRQDDLNEATAEGAVNQLRQFN